MNKTVNIKFYLNTQKGTKEKRPIYLYMYVKGKPLRKSIGRTISESEWSEKDQKARHNKELNSFIAELTTRFYQIQSELEKRDKGESVQTIYNIMFGVEASETYLLDFINQYVTNALNTGRIKSGTGLHYQTVKGALSSFIGNKDVNIKAVDYKFIKGFDEYLHQLDKELDHNTINGNYHKKLRAILNDAIKERIITENPYKAFKITIKETKREYLSSAEVKVIREAIFDSQSLNKVRDLFIFSCYTGLRFSDVTSLQMSDIRYRDGGDLYLYKTQIKTENAVSPPIPTIAKQIIEKYASDPNRLVNNKVFPVISNQKINSYLKVIADLSGINKKLSFHVARHTYATTLLNNDVQIEIIQRALGHKSVRTTQIYAKITNENFNNQILNAFEDGTD